MRIYIYIIFFLETDYSASEFCFSFQNQTLAQLQQRLGPGPNSFPIPIPSSHSAWARIPFPAHPNAQIPSPAPPTPGRAVPVSARAAGRRRARPAPARPLFIGMAGGNRPFPAGRDRSCQACPALPASSRVCVCLGGCLGGSPWAGGGNARGGLNSRAWDVPVRRWQPARRAPASGVGAAAAAAQSDGYKLGGEIEVL